MHQLYILLVLQTSCLVKQMHWWFFFYILIFWLLQKLKIMKSTRYKFQCEISEFMKCCWDKKLCTGRSKQNQFLKIKNNIKFINLLQICDPELYCSLKIEYVLLIFNGCLKWMIKQILNLKQGIRLVCNLHLKFLKVLVQVYI